MFMTIFKVEYFLRIVESCSIVKNLKIYECRTKDHTYYLNSIYI